MLLTGVAVELATRARRVAASTIDDLVFGGIEEEILARGSDWCTDVARVMCALAQIAGLSARIVILADTSAAYSGHVVTEVFRSRWGVVDALHGVICRDADAQPMSAADLHDNPGCASLIGPFATGPAPELFQNVAISDYRIEAHSGYDYTTSRVNDYYRSILTQAERGWPDGLHWLHGEDRRSNP